MAPLSLPTRGAFMLFGKIKLAAWLVGSTLPVSVVWPLLEAAQAPR